LGQRLREIVDEICDAASFLFFLVCRHPDEPGRNIYAYDLRSLIGQ
jgi:hypothetical protein